MSKSDFKWTDIDTEKITEFSEWYEKQDKFTGYEDFGEFVITLHENTQK